MAIDSSLFQAEFGSIMALQLRSPSSHNKMMLMKIRHLPSTDTDSEEFPIPISKRVKRFESDQTKSRLSEDETSLRVSHSPNRQHQTEIADSEADDDDEDGGMPIVAKPDGSGNIPAAHKDR